MNKLINGAFAASALTLAAFGAVPAFANGALSPLNGFVASSLPEAAPSSVVISIVDFDVAGIFSNDGFGAPINEVYTIDIGAFSEVIGIGWDVTLFADSPSYLSEMIVTFSPTDLSTGIDLSVAPDDTFPGLESYSSGGIINVVDLGLNFSVGADGLLRLEFWEDFVDFPGDWDGIWESGTLSIQYAAPEAVIPEPATWGLMIAGFGLVGFAARRRRMVPLSQ